MPRYFIDLRDGDKIYTDEKGSDHFNREHARREAISLLPEIARDELPHGEHWTLVATVRDTAGHELYEATLTFTGRWLK